MIYKKGKIDEIMNAVFSANSCLQAEESGVWK